MKWNFKKELARKSIHFLSIFILLIYLVVSDLFNRNVALVILVLILIVSLEFEYFRIEIGRHIPIISDVWKSLRRGKEKYQIGGDVFFLIGAILVLSVFDLRVAMAAILMTTFGDMAAALIGKRFGKHYLKLLKERAWEGILAEFIVDIIIGFIVFIWISYGSFYDLKIWLVIFVMALTATFVETIIYKMDDNLLIPVFAGFNGHVLLILLGYL